MMGAKESNEKASEAILEYDKKWKSPMSKNYVRGWTPPKKEKKAKSSD